MRRRQASECGGLTRRRGHGNAPEKKERKGRERKDESAVPSAKHRTTQSAAGHSVLPATDPGAIRRHTATTTAAPCVLSWRQPRASEPQWWHGVRWNQTGGSDLGMQAGRNGDIDFRLLSAMKRNQKNQPSHIVIIPHSQYCKIIQQMQPIYMN